MRIAKSLLLLIVLPLVSVNAQNAYFSSSLSSPIINAMVEYPHGGLMIGTDHGLNLYTGETYYVFSTNQENDIIIDEITSLAIGTRGELIIGSTNGISIYDNNTFISSKQEYDYSNIINTIKALNSDEYIISDNFGVQILNGKTLNVEKYYITKGYNTSSTLEITDKNEIWIDYNEYPNRVIAEFNLTVQQHYQV